MKVVAGKALATERLGLGLIHGENGKHRTP